MGCHSLLQEIFPTWVSCTEADSLLSETPEEPNLCILAYIISHCNFNLQLPMANGAELFINCLFQPFVLFKLDHFMSYNTALRILYIYWLLLVFYCTGTCWSRVDDERVKERKRLKFPELCSWLLRSREPAKKQRDRERERQTDMGTQALMEQRCFNQHGVGMFTVSKVLLSAKINIKIPDLQNIRRSLLKREL